jgi:hypothetical protein
MHLEVLRSDFHRVRAIAADPGPLAAGDARVTIETFALSSNNISYAAFGDALRYWEFFPAAAGAEGESWGRIPVWGYARVTESDSPDLAVGERLYGYWPMGSSLDITPGRANDRAVSDLAPHRAEMSSTYSRYSRVAADPMLSSGREAHQMLLFPLFYTSFLADDFLADNDDFGSGVTIVSSASSKTAIGVAHRTRARGRRCIGLTSAPNRGFTESLGVYEQVLTYDEIAHLAVEPSEYVDIAGNAAVTRAVHERLGDALAHSMIVGGTHWDQPGDATGAALPGPRPTFFFAPTQITKRVQEWGQETMDARLGAAWDEYATWCDGWIEFREFVGPEAVTGAYLELLEAGADPRVGYICTLDPAATPR